MTCAVKSHVPSGFTVSLHDHRSEISDWCPVTFTVLCLATPPLKMMGKRYEDRLDSTVLEISRPPYFISNPKTPQIGREAWLRTWR